MNFADQNTASIQTAQTADAMAAILDRQEKMMMILASPKDLLDENGKVIRSVVHRGNM